MLPRRKWETVRRKEMRRTGRGRKRRMGGEERGREAKGMELRNRYDELKGPAEY